MIRFPIFVVFFAVYFSIASVADELSFQSPERQVSLFELFVNSDCGTACGEANRFLNNLRKRPSLWKTFVPIQFEVGQNEKTAEFSLRKQSYASEWGRAVSSPQFIENGREWKLPELPNHEKTTHLEKLGGHVGILSVKENNSVFDLSFIPMSHAPDWIAHGVLMGTEILPTKKEAGKEPLNRDFIAVIKVQKKMEKIGTAYRAMLELTPPSDNKLKHLSVAFWISQENEMKPEQAIGFDLPSPKHRKKRKPSSKG